MQFFYQWQEAVEFLNRRITALQPRPGRNIFLQPTAEGMEIHAQSTTENEENTAYQGFFQVRIATLDTGEAAVQVVGGPGLDAFLLAGQVFLAGQIFPVPQSPRLPLPTTATTVVIALQMTFTEATPQFSYQAVAAGLPGNWAAELPQSDLLESRPLAFAVVEDGQWQLQQLQFGPIYLQRWG